MNTQQDSLRRFSRQALRAGQGLALCSLGVIGCAAEETVSGTIDSEATEGVASAALAGEAETAFMPYLAENLGTRDFYRTLFATQTVASTCRAKGVSQGIYDAPVNRTYFVYSAGLAGPSQVPGAPYSAANPTIFSYDHTRGWWEGPVQLENVRALQGATSDCHNYPQVVVDAAGYIHVFHSFHNSGLNIRHYTSRTPHSVTAGWTVQEVSGTHHNTYGGAFIDNQGEIYVFFRSSYAGGPSVWYEPEMYVKSTNNGATWSAPKLAVDPGRPSSTHGTESATITNLINDGGWNTVYVGDMLQDRSNNRIALTFTINHNHGDWVGERLFAYFDMTSDRLKTAGGTDLGPTVDRTEYTTGGCCTMYKRPPRPSTCLT
jgi:hypothetical protein